MLWRIYAIISLVENLTVSVIETNDKLKEQQSGAWRRVSKGDSYVQFGVESSG